MIPPLVQCSYLRAESPESTSGECTAPGLSCQAPPASIPFLEVPPASTLPTRPVPEHGARQLKRLAFVPGLAIPSGNMRTVPWLPEPSLTLRQLARGDKLEASLEAGGLPSRAAAAHAELLSVCASVLILRGEGGASPARAFVAPGRIEILGKHTDYCGGRSLLAAMEQGMAFVGVPTPGQQVEITDAVRNESASFALSAHLEPRRGHWSVYPMTVTRRLSRNFPPMRQGVRLAFAGNLPGAAGMSSSSVLITGCFLVVGSLNEIESREEFQAQLGDGESLASYLAAMENGSDFGVLEGDSGVGTRGGSEDHTAILRCRPGHLSLCSFAPLRLEKHIRAPASHIFTVAASGISAEKTGAALERYNRAARLARAVVDVWNQAAGRDDRHIAAILVHVLGEVDRVRAILERARHPEFSPSELLDRLDHFYEEGSRILPHAARLLEEGNIRDFGKWVDRSQEFGARLLKNQVPETLHLARAARRLGAPAASAFGAGFGGSVWALVPREEARGFTDRWLADYSKAFPATAERSIFLSTEASTAAFEVSG